jgi:hypothetical protein
VTLFLLVGLWFSLPCLSETFPEQELDEASGLYSLRLSELPCCVFTIGKSDGLLCYLSGGIGGGTNSLRTYCVLC